MSNTSQSELSANKNNFTVSLCCQEFLRNQSSEEGQLGRLLELELELGFTSTHCLGSRDWNRTFLVDAMISDLGMISVPALKLGYI